MRYLNMLPRFLLTLPRTLRLCLVILCAAVFQLLFVALAHLEQNPSLLAIPVVVAAWIYRRRGVFISIISLTITTWAFYAFHLKILWFPRSMTLSFLIGDLALLTIGLLISSQRDSFERAEENRQLMARAYEQEQSLHLAKDQFIQNVNHELRTPLTALSGFIELLQEQNECFDAETRATFLQNASLSCEELLQLVNSILNSLQVRRNDTPVPLKETRLDEFVNNVIQQTDPDWHLRQLTSVNISEHIIVQAFQPYLSQILHNLLSNAVKYAPGEQPVLLTARPIIEPTTGRAEVCISVKDSGPGIPPGEVTRIFEQFTRLQRDALGQIRGAGLGLSISKQLVEKMNGRIWVESTGIPGQGSCFNFTLLAANPAQIPILPSQTEIPIYPAQTKTRSNSQPLLPFA